MEGMTIERHLRVTEPAASEAAVAAVARSLAPRGVRRHEVRAALVGYMADALAAFVAEVQ